MKKCIEINLTKKTIEMIENIRGNLVEFAVALLRAGRGLKLNVMWMQQNADRSKQFWRILLIRKRIVCGFIIWEITIKVR